MRAAAGVETAAGAEASSRAETVIVPRRAVGERGLAMWVGQTGPRADAPRRVAPTTAGLPRADPGQGPAAAVPRFPLVVAAP